MSRRGYTLVELMIAMVLLGLVMAGASGVYVAAQRFLNGMINNDVRVVTPSLALEAIIRRTKAANQIVFDAGNNQIKLRTDPNRTPENTADDVWFKYRVIGSRLRWTQAAVEAGDVGGGDPDVEPDLRVRPGSGFAMLNPSATGAANVLQITIITNEGSPPVDQTVRSSVAVAEMVKA
ncbi:MAG: hypothetical protein MOGMAGMI_00968 [Candidatus Omnitrophica bacterium]|nr:hypothetical protein [Candidatus Omnitrophota bacterium]